jgi:hypothetical protein
VGHGGKSFGSRLQAIPPRKTISAGAKTDHGSGGIVPPRAAQKSSTYLLPAHGREGWGIFTVDLYLKVRLACSEGMSQREAAKHFNLSRDTVRKMLSFSVPPGYRHQAEIKRPKLDAFVGIIDSILEADRTAPRKQRHTAKRIYGRLKDEFGFTGGAQAGARGAGDAARAVAACRHDRHDPGAERAVELGVLYGAGGVCGGAAAVALAGGVAAVRVEWPDRGAAHEG